MYNKRKTPYESCCVQKDVIQLYLVFAGAPAKYGWISNDGLSSNRAWPRLYKLILFYILCVGKEINMIDCSWLVELVGLHCKKSTI